MNTSIILSAPELRVALGGLLKVAVKTNLPVSSFIHITRDADGIIVLQASDLDSLLSYQFEQPQARIAVEVLLPLEPLVHAAKSAKDRIGILLESEERVFLQSFVGSIPMEEPMETLHPSNWPVF